MDPYDDWQAVLTAAVRRAKARVVGAVNVREIQHARLVATALDAFGSHPGAAFYIDIRSTLGNIPRPDLILVHPDLGVVVVENKGVGLNDILDVYGTILRLTRDGQLKEEDPYFQAGRVMFCLRDLLKSRTDPNDALFLHTVALPRIRRVDFEPAYGNQFPDETIFAEECDDPTLFRNHLVNFADHEHRRTRLREKLSIHAAGAIGTILDGKGFIYTARRRHLDDADSGLIGDEIRRMELALKEPTQQQRELGRADLRGNHRLFRGVAGSGKSVMLALSVAHTLVKNREDRQADLFQTVGPRKVLVVCFNRTLVHYLRDRINDRFGRLAWDKPAEDELTVVHFEGLVRQLQTKSRKFQTGFDYRQKGPRASAIVAALDGMGVTERGKYQFDAVYVDEAQDFLPDEFGVLSRLCRKDESGKQTLILFYDNAQNIYAAPTPVWSHLGINIVGRTVFLDQCHRNTTQLLRFAFNVLVGSFAPEGVRVNTRKFADVDSLKDRGLIVEAGGRFDILFTPRSGPLPVVRRYSERTVEIDRVVEMFRRLVNKHRVEPSDILILFKSHHPYSETLGPKLNKVLGRQGRVRFVDSVHNDNKRHPLIQEGVLTVSTIASAKGYDAPIVFLIGVDRLRSDVTDDRALFYVAATRSKARLIVTGVRRKARTLLDEVKAVAMALA